MLLPLGRAIVPCMSQQSLAIPPFTAQMAEQVCKALADAVTGSQIPGLIAFLKVAEGPGQAQGTKWVRLYNAVAARQNIQHDGRPLIRLVSEVMTPVRFASQAEFDSARARVNQRLLLAGFEVLESGKVGKARPAATIGEARQRADDLRAELARRDVHPDVLRFCRAELVQQNYFHAVLEAAKSVADKLRTLTGLQGDGSSLVDAACSVSSGPRIAFNGLAAEWERSEQTGIATLMKGMFSTFRNPVPTPPE
jgi:uncharacterized protein (TIGR02391 family)